MHEMVKDSLDRVLMSIWIRLGKEQPAIEDAWLHRFAGSRAYRSIRHGNALSMHSYGVALDFAGNHFPRGRPSFRPG
jgi:hypothetical protein